MGLIKKSNIVRNNKRRQLRRYPLEKKRKLNGSDITEEQKNVYRDETTENKVLKANRRNNKNLYGKIRFRDVCNEAFKSNDPDAEEIAYLERRLGLTGLQREKNLEHLKKEWKEADGLDDDILQFADLIMNLGRDDSQKINKQCNPIYSRQYPKQVRKDVQENIPTEWKTSSAESEEEEKSTKSLSNPCSFGIKNEKLSKISYQRTVGDHLTKETLSDSLHQHLQKDKKHSRGESLLRSSRRSKITPETISARSVLVDQKETSYKDLTDGSKDVSTDDMSHESVDSSNNDSTDDSNDDSTQDSSEELRSGSSEPSTNDSNEESTSHSNDESTNDSNGGSTNDSNEGSTNSSNDISTDDLNQDFMEDIDEESTNDSNDDPTVGSNETFMDDLNYYEDEQNYDSNCDSRNYSKNRAKHKSTSKTEIDICKDSGEGSLSDSKNFLKHHLQIDVKKNKLGFFSDKAISGLKNKSQKAAFSVNEYKEPEISCELRLHGAQKNLPRLPFSEVGEGASRSSYDPKMLGSVCDPDKSNKQSAKYVIPVRRPKKNESRCSSNQVSKSVLPQRIRTKITGLVNRIVEGNLSLIIDKILSEIFLESTAHLVKDKASFHIMMKKLSLAFAQTVATCAIENPFSTPSLVGSQVVVIICLTARVGYQIGQEFIISLVQLFEKYWNRLISSENSVSQPSEHDPHGEFEEEQRIKVTSGIKTCLRLIMIAWSLLYDFGLLDNTGIVVLVHHLTPEMNEALGDDIHLETRLELLLICFRHVGIKLKTSSPEDFTQVLQCSLQSFETAAPGSSKRLFYFLQELQDMKRNKFNLHSSIRFEYLRTWLKKFLHDSQNKLGERSLDRFAFSISNWDEVASGDAVPTCIACEEPHQQSLLQAHRYLNQSNTNALLDQAKKLKLHSDIQRNSFLALVGAVDVHDALNRLLAVAHKSSQILQTVATIIHTALHERTLNPFYSQVLIDLSVLPSSVGNKYKRAVKECVLTHLAQVPQYSLRKIIVLAYIVSRLILSCLSNINTRLLRFCGLASFNEAQGTQRSQIFVCQVCKEMCCYESLQSTYSSLNELKEFEHHIRYLLNYQDLSNLFLLTARRLLKQKGTSEHITQRAERIIEILS